MSKHSDSHHCVAHAKPSQSQNCATKRIIMYSGQWTLCEARDLLARWLYLEGVVWCLAGIYERKLNLEALEQCRFFLHRSSWS